MSFPQGRPISYTSYGKNLEYYNLVKTWKLPGILFNWLNIFSFTCHLWISHGEWSHSGESWGVSRRWLVEIATVGNSFKKWFWKKIEGGRGICERNKVVHLLFVFKKRKSYAYLQLFRMNLDGDILKIQEKGCWEGKSPHEGRKRCDPQYFRAKRRSRPHAGGGLLFYCDCKVRMKGWRPRQVTMCTLGPEFEGAPVWVVYPNEFLFLCFFPLCSRWARLSMEDEKKVISLGDLWVVMRAWPGHCRK